MNIIRIWARRRRRVKTVRAYRQGQVWAVKAIAEGMPEEVIRFLCLKTFNSNYLDDAFDAGALHELEDYIARTRGSK